MKMIEFSAATAAAIPATTQPPPPSRDFARFADVALLLGRQLLRNLLSCDVERRPKSLPIPKNQGGGEHYYDFPFAMDGMDWEMFKMPSLTELSRVVFARGGGALLPQEVNKDGMCLLHSISKSVFGSEVYSGVLREMIRVELLDNKVQ